MNMFKSGHLPLLQRIEARSARVGVIGLGYVGLPLAVTTAERGFPVTGFDVDASKMDMLDAGKSYIGAVGADRLAGLAKAGNFDWTVDFTRLKTCDVIIICVPTPLTRAPRAGSVLHREHRRRRSPPTCKAGTLVVLESTTYPGTTDEVLTPILETSRAEGRGGFLHRLLARARGSGQCQLPHRDDPQGRRGRRARPAARWWRPSMAAVVDRVVPVSSTRTAEAVKITENIFRAVNIALVNELKVIYDAMGIDVWEVIDAAATKPFGFMPFYPGPGLGGHCIPIDPFYLTWKAREYERVDPVHRTGRRDQHRHAALCGVAAAARCWTASWAAASAGREGADRGHRLQEERLGHARKPLDAADGDAGSRGGRDGGLP